MCSVLGRERTRTQRNANTAHLFCKGTKQKGMQKKKVCSKQALFGARIVPINVFFGCGGTRKGEALLFVTEPGGLFQAMRYFGYGRVGKEVSVTKSGAFCNGRG